MRRQLIVLLWWSSVVSAQTDWPSLRRRQLQDRRSVLVVRIKGPNETPQLSQAHEIDLDRLLWANAVSVKSQMRLCSNGQVELQSTDPSILSLDVDPPQSDPKNRTLWKEEAATVILDHFDIQALNPVSRLRTLADHVVIILPTNYPDPKFVAEAEVGKSLSLFSYSWSNSLPTFMHEFGHNMGLRHARIKDDPYGDTSGYMGHSWSTVQQKCYNAAQHWQLDWFQNQRLSLLRGSRDILEIIPFVDASRFPSKIVLVKLDETRYLQLNAAKKHNQDTSIYKNKVVVVQDYGNHTRVVAGLAASNTYESGRVSVKVCEIVTGDPMQYDHATLSFNGECPEISPCSDCDETLEDPPVDSPNDWQDEPRHDAPFDLDKDSSNDYWTPLGPEDIDATDSEPGQTWMVPTMATLGAIGAVALIVLLFFCRRRKKVAPQKEVSGLQTDIVPPSDTKSFSETAYGSPREDAEAPNDPIWFITAIRELIDDCHFFH